VYNAAARRRFQHFSPDARNGVHKPKLLDRGRAVARVRHLSLRTEQAYSDWFRRFILFHGKRRPGEMGAVEPGERARHAARAGELFRALLIGGALR
jgi:hypothetical protein